jgi:glycosyltransferase involved in cell wall biosynthesis
MYLVLPVPFRVVAGEIFVESQAANGLDRWADHFERVVVAAPVIPEHLVAGLAGVVWSPISALEHRDRIVTQPLPWAYTPRAFARNAGRVWRLINDSIAQSRHLQFAIGGLVGDWAALAAVAAIRQRRRYAIHTDRVEHLLIRKTAPGSSAVRRLRVAIEAPLMEWYHRHIIGHATLGLWHGEECFQAYAPWCRQNFLVHDIHTKAADQITSAALDAKIEKIHLNDSLQVIYPGRLDPMKAPLEWLAAIAVARDRGANLLATWYGEGQLLAQAQAEVERLNLQEIVRFPGFVADRATLLGHIRAAHVLVFTHITPESPRNLLESLVSGTAIVGYANPYAENLLKDHGGGVLVPMHNTNALGTLIADLNSDRERLAELTRAAAASGRRFTDAVVFAERSALVKQYA